MGTNAKGWVYTQTTTPRSDEELQEMMNRKDDQSGGCPSLGITFINLSNHPISGWCDEKKSAAHVDENRIVEIPFPDINPSADTETIRNLARGYFDQIVEQHKIHPPTTVYLEGEMTFCFQLASLIQQSSYRIRVVTSTYENNRENPDGTFNFVKFRELFTRW